jgi:hypothetical protein
VAEARLIALRGLNHGPATHRRRPGTSKLSFTRAAKWQLGASNGKPKMSAKNRTGHLAARRHDGVVQDDGDGTPQLAARTVDNIRLSKTSVGG